MLIANKQFEVVGRILNNQVINRGQQVERRVITLEGNDKVVDVYSAYALQILDANKVKENDLVKIIYKKCGTERLYNRIDKIELVSNNIHEIITGVISNTNNVRGSKGKQKDEVCFCLKQKGNKVFYCYINKDLAKSMFFNKGNSVQLEVIKENRNITHESYRVISIWKV